MQITLELLRENYRYTECGLLYWSKPGHMRDLTKPVGTMTKRGYLTCTLYGVALKVHRVIFWMHNGYLPEEVDHADRVKHNNAPDNLRAATGLDNSKNREQPIGKTGYRWVSFTGSAYRWEIKVKDKRQRKGGYASAEDAYKDACAAHRVLAKEFSPV